MRGRWVRRGDVHYPWPRAGGGAIAHAVKNLRLQGNGRRRLSLSARWIDAERFGLVNQ